jgi:putative acetyltransferase
MIRTAVQNRGIRDYEAGDAPEIVRLFFETVEREARGQGLGWICTEASITARPFFEQQGFRVVREQMVSRRGVSMTNFVMEKELPG